MTHFADRVSLPRDAWYVGAASSQLGADPLAVTIHGQPIVLFRDTAGEAHAIHDRCPHRGVALSLGKVVQGEISCAYHGWRFDGAGRCQHIPSLIAGEESKAISVRPYPVSERDGYIWLWLGAGAPPAPPMPIPEYEAFCWIQGAMELACEASLPIENNLDICHAAFTHPQQHPQWFRVQAQGFIEATYALDVGATGLVVSGPGVTLRFDLPDRVTVGSSDGFRIVLHHVPTVPGRCVQHWLLQRGASEVGVAPVWSDSEPEILAQDRCVLESAQRAYEREGDGFERSVVADSPTLAARRLLAMIASGQPGTGSIRDTRKTFVARS